MSNVFADITMSLDGYVAGPDPTLEEPLGRNGESLHEWAFASQSWRESHGRSGGERNADSDVIDEIVGRSGADVMGRLMFSGGSGPWQDDPKALGWWGDEPPFHQPVFVVTHHVREPLVLGETTFTFVTGGVSSAVAAARDAAAGKDVHIAGGASVIQQAIAEGVLDELIVHVSPMLLGGGTRLFAEGTTAPVALTRTVASDAVSHLFYAIRR
jgi:dihydrofolate reductase